MAIQIGRKPPRRGANLLLPPANEVWGKVIFSIACVKVSVHMGAVPGPVGRGCLVSGPGGRVPGPRGVSGPGGCLVSGGCLVPGCAWSRGGVWSQGCLVSGDLVPGVSGPGACLALGRCLWRPPNEMAVAAGDTHPTGMHSC